MARGGPRAVVVVPRAEPCWEPGGAPAGAARRERRGRIVPG